MLLRKMNISPKKHLALWLVFRRIPMRLGGNGSTSGHLGVPNKTRPTLCCQVLYEEFLAPKIFLSLVPDITEAIRLINAYSGKHSATIVTNEFPQATRFMQEVDCAAVYHNASTRFTDGGEFGLGAEIAISTQKLHFRGPIGAEQLVTNKWFVYGNGHIRE
jgi:gamma-glutamyl phosphate reductase